METMQLNHHINMRQIAFVVTTGVFGLLQVKFFPDINLIQWLGLSIILDFLTAFYRAKTREEARNSKRVRATFPKVFMYFGSMVAIIIVENAFNLTKGGPTQTVVTNFFNNLFILLMIYAEVLSILENIIVLNRKDIFTMFVLIPIYRVLTLQFKGNILTKIGKENPDDKNNLFDEKEQ